MLVKVNLRIRKNKINPHVSKENNDESVSLIRNKTKISWINSLNVFLTFLPLELVLGLIGTCNKSFGAVWIALFFLSLKGFKFKSSPYFDVDSLLGYILTWFCNFNLLYI